jgi:hypothetical protein
MSDSELPSPPPIDEAKNLAAIADFIGLHVVTEIQAAIVVHASMQFFAYKPNAFVTNPANTLVYRAFDALEEQSVVNLMETLRGVEKVHPVTTEIRRRIDLVLHRDAISHPVLVVWSKPEKQAFFEQGRKWKDIRPALVWDLHRSINERLKELGAEPGNETIPVTRAMAIAVRDILRLSMNAESAAAILSEEETLAGLAKFRDEYLDFLVKHPDGQRSPQR